MLEAAGNLPVVVEIDSRHLKSVTPQSTKTVTVDQGRREPSEPDHRTKQFRESSHVEAELAVESALRVREARDVGEPVSIKEELVTLVVAHVNQNDPATACLNFFSLICQVSKRFPTECASSVAEKDNQLRPQGSEFVQLFATVRKNLQQWSVGFGCLIGRTNALVITGD